MVCIRNFLVAAITLGVAAVLALPTGNSTIDSRDSSDLVCGADHVPKTKGLPSPDEQVNATAVDDVALVNINYVVKVHWHVIYKNPNYAGGRLSASQVASAINALNQHYSSTGISFVRVGSINYVQNTAWFNGADNQAGSGLTTAMRDALHIGGTDHLNIYSVGFQMTNIGGFGTYPWLIAGRQDGVVFRWNTTPGGSQARYNQGKILSHEVGHWCGLYHTYRGGCSSLGGDLVSDTAPEASAAIGCPIGRNTCPGSGVDPIHNLMDETYDTCKSGSFTPGQGARMRGALSTYRF